MTLEELKNKYPELIAEIEQDVKNSGGGQSEQDVVKQERERIEEIEKIANAVGDKELLHKAKFETPMSAAELALAAMKKQAEAGISFMEN